MTATDALDVAKAADAGAGKVDASDPSGLKAGQKISVTPDDTGKVPVTGVAGRPHRRPRLDHAQRPAGGRRRRPLPARRLRRRPSIARFRLSAPARSRRRRWRGCRRRRAGPSRQQARPAHLDALRRCRSGARRPVPSDSSRAASGVAALPVAASSIVPDSGENMRARRRVAPALCRHGHRGRAAGGAAPCAVKASRRLAEARRCRARRASGPRR